MKSRYLGQTKNGIEVMAYTLKNTQGMELEVLDYGATVRALRVPDAAGLMRDVVLGYDTVADYEAHTYYFGAAIGRNANRIAGAQCEIEGQVYPLEANDGANNLHSGSAGFHQVMWKAEYESETANQITFTYFSKDGEQGYPGNMQVAICYTLTDENEMIIDYQAKTDQTTIANFTNHTYYNLNGHASGSIEDQQIQILAAAYTPVMDSGAIPTGEVVTVADTPMDFRTMKRIGQDIEDDFSQLIYAGGYDHNYVLPDTKHLEQRSASAFAAESGIRMDVYTDCPGLQFYTGNFIEKHAAKEQAEYDRRQGFCLETQYFPNAANETKFETPLLQPGETYHSRTRVCFIQ